MQYDASGQNSWLQRYERRLALKGFRCEMEPFTYTFPFANPVTNGATVSATITTDRDSDFAVLTPMRQANNNATGADLPTPLHEFELRLETTGRILDDRQLNVQNFFGTALRPHRLAVPLFVQSRGSVTMTLVNNEAAASRVFYSLVGVKIYVFEVRDQRELQDLKAELGLHRTPEFAEQVVAARRR